MPPWSTSKLAPLSKESFSGAKDKDTEVFKDEHAGNAKQE